MGSKKTTDLEALAERLQEQGFSSLSSLDLKLLGSSHMTWKEKKALQNERVVSLGGKPVKKQRVPLSLARVTMKKQKEREQKTLQEDLVLGRFSGNKSSSSNRAAGKRKAEDSVLRSTEGYFKNGVLNVKHLLHNNSARSMENRPSRPKALNFGTGTGTGTSDKGKSKQGGGKKKGGKKRGKKRH
ncbi:hypothetical protein MKW94_001250 [Papaver nudicaule]|uniref:Uncharacterized protein n=1 Tax=Papaver nudicaule TaxID=74823 RepID=A0AA41RVH2_PAPNU|nr:hypothetical protein [Papaver nudicaule]